MATAPRKDADNLRTLEQLRPVYERLKADRIRTESDLQRLQQDYETARKSAIETLGTDDENAIRAHIQQIWAQNTEAVESFRQLLQEIETDLKTLPTE